MQKCLKCSRTGFLSVEKDNAHLPFIYCGACGNTMYKHLMERKMNISSAQSVSPFITNHGSKSGKLRQAIITGNTTFTAKMMATELKIEIATVRSLISGLIRTHEIKSVSRGIFTVDNAESLMNRCKIQFND